MSTFLHCPVVELVNVPAVARNRMNHWTSPLASRQVLSNCRSVGDSRFHCARPDGATSEWCLPASRLLVTFSRGHIGASPMEIRIRARRLSSRSTRGQTRAGTLTRSTTGLGIRYTPDSSKPFASLQPILLTQCTVRFQEHALGAATAVPAFNRLYALMSTG